MDKEKAAVENPVKAHAERTGWFCFKVTPMGRRGFPDHLFFYRYPTIAIIEFKAEGKSLKVGGLQEYIINLLLKLGWPVYVVNDPEVGKQLLDELKEQHK